MKKTLQWERVRTRQEEKIQRFSSVHSQNIHDLCVPHDDLYRCSANFLFGDESEQESKDPNFSDQPIEHPNGFHGKALPVPKSLKLFDTNGNEYNSGLPPFLHFSPLTKNQPFGKNEDLNSNTNHSSIISRDLRYNTASTDNKSFIFTPINDYWENYGKRDKNFLPRKHSSKKIRENFDI